jgi:hypothetical protein
MEIILILGSRIARWQIGRVFEVFFKHQGVKFQLLFQLNVEQFYEKFSILVINVGFFKV